MPLHLRYMYVYIRSMKAPFLAATLLLLFPAFYALAQTPPQGISYQAVARDPMGDELPNTGLVVKAGIRGGSINGPLIWEEEHPVSTDEFGLFSLVIGGGISTGEGSAATFAQIPWASNSHFLNISIDTGNGVFLNMGTSQFLSVPYAYVAARSLDNDDADANPENELISGFTLENQTLSITEAGSVYEVDLSEALSDGDEVIGNESISLIQLQGSVLNMVESGEVFQIDLSELPDDGDWEKENGTVYNTQDKIGIGTAAPTSNLHVSGSMSLGINYFSGINAVSLDETHCVAICDVSLQSVQVSLPSATSCPGRMYIVKKISNLPLGTPITNTISIYPQVGELIDNENSLLLDSFFRQEITLISDGSRWFVLNRSSNE